MVNGVYAVVSQLFFRLPQLCLPFLAIRLEAEEIYSSFLAIYLMGNMFVPYVYGGLQKRIEITQLQDKKLYFILVSMIVAGAPFIIGLFSILIYFFVSEDLYSSVLLFWYCVTYFLYGLTITYMKNIGRNKSIAAFHLVSSTGILVAAYLSFKFSNDAIIFVYFVSYMMLFVFGFPKNELVNCRIDLKCFVSELKNHIYYFFYTFRNSINMGLDRLLIMFIGTASDVTIYSALLASFGAITLLGKGLYQYFSPQIISGRFNLKYRNLALTAVVAFSVLYICFIYFFSYPLFQKELGILFVLSGFVIVFGRAIKEFLVLKVITQSAKSPILVDFFVTVSAVGILGPIVLVKTDYMYYAQIIAITTLAITVYYIVRILKVWKRREI